MATNGGNNKNKIKAVLTSITKSPPCTLLTSKEIGINDHLDLDQQLWD
jgi:hypothetical protein